MTAPPRTRLRSAAVARRRRAVRVPVVRAGPPRHARPARRPLRACDVRPAAPDRRRAAALVLAVATAVAVAALWL